MVRNILIGLVVIVIAVVGLFFVLPPVASKTQTFTVDRPAASVFARLASTPVGAQLAEGVTQGEVTSAENNVVVADLAYADGGTGRATYNVSESGGHTQVQLRFEKDLGANPLNRFGAITGAGIGPVADAAAAAVSADLGALPTASFTGLAYDVVQVEAQPFFYVENCSSSDAESITSIVSQAVAGIPPVMRTNSLTPAGPLMAVEPRVVSDQYCYQVGYPYRGRQPRALLFGKTGQSPAGTMLHMSYAGAEQDVVPQVYDKMDALLAAAHLDDPATTNDDWTTYEVYNDDATQAGGSRNRDIYYVTTGDIARLTAIAPPTTPAAAPAAVLEAPAAPAAPVAPAPTTPAPATTP